MSIKIGKNITSLTVQRNLGESSRTVADLYEKLASGQRITRASDDAAGLAIKSSLEVNSRIFGQAVRNLNDGISVASVADAALRTLSDIVQRQLELAEQSANGSYSTIQRQALNEESRTLRDEYNRVLATTQFNGVHLFSGSSGKIQLQDGIGSTGTLDLTLRDTVSANQVTAGPGYTSTFTHTVGEINFDLALSDLGLYSVGIWAGDFNGDGFDDLVVGINSPAQDEIQVGLYQSNGDGTFAFKSNFILGPASTWVADLTVGFGDVDGDGDTDIALGYDFGSGTQETFLRNNSNTTFASQVAGGGAITKVFQDSVMGDFNGDGFEEGAAFITNTIEAELRDTVTTVTQSLQSFTQDTFSILSQASARTAIESLTTQLSTLTTARGKIGAGMSRIESALRTAQSRRDLTNQAASRIGDFDVASGAAELTRTAVLQNSAQAILAQANQDPQIVLSLLASF